MVRPWIGVGPLLGPDLPVMLATKAGKVDISI